MAKKKEMCSSENHEPDTVNQSLQQSNDDLRNRNGLKSRGEQEQLEKEIKDVRNQNCNLEELVDMSSAKATRIAKENNMSEEKVGAIIEKCTDSRFLGVFGEKNRKCSESQFDVGRYPVTSALKR